MESLMNALERQKISLPIVNTKTMLLLPRFPSAAGRKLANEHKEAKAWMSRWSALEGTRFLQIMKNTAERTSSAALSIYSEERFGAAIDLSTGEVTAGGAVGGGRVRKKMRYLTIALTKRTPGVPDAGAAGKVGITCDEMKNKDTRKLIFTDEEHKLRFFPRQRSGCTDLCGVRCSGYRNRRKGHDSGGREDASTRVLDLSCSKCRMCICGPESARESCSTTSRSVWQRSTQTLPRFTSTTASTRPLRMIKLNGSIELAPIVGLSEVIVDIVETGSTLRENGLTVLEEESARCLRVWLHQPGEHADGK